jgi:hypothetical protein
MADDTDGRESRARNAENRQRQRGMTEALERVDETEPPVADAELDAVEARLDDVTFPATGSEVVTDWIVEQMETTGKRPGSRAVRRRAAKFCRSNGYPAATTSGSVSRRPEPVLFK